MILPAGISDAARAFCDTTVRLPMSGRADSLNVAVATGVILYELVRRTQPVIERAELRQSKTGSFPTN